MLRCSRKIEVTRSPFGTRSCACGGSKQCEPSKSVRVRRPEQTRDDAPRACAARLRCLGSEHHHPSPRCARPALAALPGCCSRTEQRGCGAQAARLSFKIEPAAARAICFRHRPAPTSLCACSCCPEQRRVAPLCGVIRTRCDAPDPRAAACRACAKQGPDGSLRDAEDEPHVLD